jgi:hypothetical protein
MKREEMTDREAMTSRWIILGLLVITMAPFAWRAIAGQWNDWITCGAGLVITSVWSFMLGEASRDVNERRRVAELKAEYASLHKSVDRMLEHATETRGASQHHIRIVE